MGLRTLPDLTPTQVVQLQDALLANADMLLSSALAILDLGHVALARSLAILGMEESGKAIAIHERRVEMGHLPDGEAFRCNWLDELWASHRKKLERVHDFLVQEPYWFDVKPPEPEQNAACVGTIRAWSRRHDRLKQRGFYVDLSKTGAVLAPADVADQESLAQVIHHVHQIGWQLRLGEHIEGKRQDDRARGAPPMGPEELEWLDSSNDPILAELLASLGEGVPAQPLNNAAYRFNPPGEDRAPFRNLGKPGYEAETRELMRVAEQKERRKGSREG